MKKLVLVLILMVFMVPATVYAQDTTQSVEGYNPNYNALPIILSLIMLYLIIYLFYANENIDKRTYKQIWGLIVVGSFLFVGTSGIILSILADYHLIFPLNFNLLFWHVEAGIILTISSIFHIHIYFRDFKKTIA